MEVDGLPRRGSSGAKQCLPTRARPDDGGSHWSSEWSTGIPEARRDDSLQRDAAARIQLRPKRPVWCPIRPEEVSQLS